MTDHISCVYQRTYESLKNLYLNSLFMQKEFAKQESNVSGDHDTWKIGFLKEWCTVRIGGPRRSGHDSALFKLIDEFDLKGAVFYPMMAQAKIIKELHNPKNVIASSERALALNDGGSFRGYSGWNFVAVNCCSHTASTTLNNVYKLAEGYLTKDPFFIILIQ